VKFPVRWQVELFDEEIMQSDMHSGLTVQDAWGQLHTTIPRLFQFATFNYAGFLQPGLIIRAEVQREEVTLGVTFEVKDNGWITFGNQTGVGNMTTRQELHASYAQHDPRIPTPFPNILKKIRDHTKTAC
jgi:hypothetical protein